MPGSKKFIATVSYEVPLVVPTDDKGVGDSTAIINSLKAFGADKISVKFTKYTGAGEHEFIKSSDAGLGLELCIKCRRTPAEAAVACPGIA